VVVDGGQLEFGHEARTGSALADHSAARTAQRDCGPIRFQSNHDAGRTVVRHDNQAVDVQVRRFGKALGHRVRQCPVPRAAAQGGGGLEPIGVGPGVELPCAELVQHRTGQRLPQVRFGFGLLHQLVATGGLEGPKGLPAILFGVVAEIQNHFAPASSARDSRMRCISMLPDDTVEA
jgi:hypothetical protein